MSCHVPPDRIAATIAFHGHSCPGLTIGIRAAELALRELGSPPQDQLVAVVETDMCGVDALQVLLGTTFGKGNLIHRDYGKMAFSFFRRDTGQGIRIVLRQDVRGAMDEELAGLMAKSARGEASAEDQDRLAALRAAVQERFLTLPLEAMFEVRAVAGPAPRPARILESLVCAGCGERVMESRTRRFAGQVYCIPCFQAVEQKV